MIALQAGMLSAEPTASRPVSTSTSAGVERSSAAIAANSPATTNIHVCVTSKSLRRSTTSASAPAGSESTNTGSADAAARSAITPGERERSVSSHAAPTLCIQVPRFETSAAIQSARKIGIRNGLPAWVSTAIESRW